MYSVETKTIDKSTGLCQRCMSSCLDTKIKRCLLPIAFLFPVTTAPKFISIFGYIYFPLVSSAAGFIIFWNFPFLVYMTASRPLYYEDLFIDESKLPNHNIHPRIRYKFQTILIWMLIFTNSILVGALSEYWLYKTETRGDVLHVIGITGGIIKIFQIINNTISRILLKIIKKKIYTENTKYNIKERESIEDIIKLKQETVDIAGIELTERNQNIIMNIIKK